MLGKGKYHNKIIVHTQLQSHPITYNTVINCYEKGSFFCVLYDSHGRHLVDKYPIASLFRVTEDYERPL